LLVAAHRSSRDGDRRREPRTMCDDDRGKTKQPKELNLPRFGGRVDLLAS
jgi:hypothetical protein